jgi:tRNA threonylcarbamoyl adenosine modification protein (Sua5/YciO/YrdC/YwlC family)
LSEIATYARVDNRQYRLLKAATPGCYAFILEATREVPKRLQHPSRRTIGLRVPAHPVVRALLGELAEPLLSSSLILPGDDVPLNDPDEMRERLEHQVDLILDAGPCGLLPTTIVNLTGPEPVIERVGKGETRLFGVPSEA